MWDWDENYNPSLSLNYYRLPVSSANTIQTQYILSHTLDYNFSILRVNRQVFEEASPDFELRNFWILVRVDIKIFGKDLKAHIKHYYHGFRSSLGSTHTTD